MWKKLVLLVCLETVSAVPIGQGDSASRPSIPSVIELRPNSLLPTKNAGGGYNKWQQLVAPAAPTTPPPVPGSSTCNCPGSVGWSSEELETLNTESNLTGAANKCFCSNSEGYWLQSDTSPQVSGEICNCPAATGWSPEVLQHYNAISNLNGSKSDCFCSYSGIYSFHELLPSGGPYESTCTCPASNGWTLTQLKKVEQLTNLSLLFYECFCESENGYSIRQKNVTYTNKYDLEEDKDLMDTLVPDGFVNSEEILLRPTTKSSSSDIKKDDYQTTEIRVSDKHTDVTDNSLFSIASTTPAMGGCDKESLILTIDENIKELRLGPLWVKFKD